MNRYVFIVHVVLFMWAIRNLLRVPRSPTETLSWIYFVIFVPIFGPLAYLIMGERHFRTKPDVGTSTLANPFREDEISQTLRNCAILAVSPVTATNSFYITANPNESLELIRENLASAQESIYVEFYIIQNDTIGTLILDTLIAKAKLGVKVYLIYDWYGSILINRGKLKLLRKAGGHVASFSPLELVFKALNPNLRNHRKLILIDGKVAISGSANIGRKYIGKKRRDQNRDYLFSLTGPVCDQLERIFVKDWNFCSRDKITTLHTALAKSNEAIPIIVVDSGPHRFQETFHLTVISLIHTAKHSIRIATPYFVPSEPLLYGLKVVAQRGIKIELIIPSKSDSRWVDLASTSFARELSEAGVQVHRFKNRMLHSKIVTIDERVVVVGTPNFDYRSFRLNYELAFVMESEQVSKAVSTIFDEDLKNSYPFDKKKRRQPLLAAENLARVLSPLL